ncbi:MAG: hypothetical protein ACLFR2_10155 [Candidatus Kapaibacterium sp.]
MRITNKSAYIPYQRNLADIQERKYKEETRFHSGKDIVSISDDPARLINIKQIRQKQSENDKHIEIMNTAVHELYEADEQIEAIAGKVTELRQLAIDGTQTGNTGNLYTLGQYVKGIMEDIIRLANSDFDGKFLFSGTKTTPDSIDPQAPAQTNFPFELVEIAPTDDNRSGLQVVFQGNMNDRIIEKDQGSTEVVNTKAEDLFGENGNSFFEPLINLYNLMTYNPDGTTRQKGDVFSTVDLGKLDKYQQELAVYADTMYKAGAKNGSKIQRLESLRNLVTSENLRLDSFRSQKEDTDVAKTAINLKQEEMALEYSLSIGPRLIQTTLFDFLR